MNAALLMAGDELAVLVPAGASVTVNKGDERDVPMALAHALVRRGVRHLHLITLPTAAYPDSGMMVDLLIVLVRHEAHPIGRRSNGQRDRNDHPAADEDVVQRPFGYEAGLLPCRPGACAP